MDKREAFKESQWGIYPWFKETDGDFVFPDDLQTFTDLQPYGKIFVCLKDDGDYLSLRYRDSVYRVKPEKFIQISTPLFHFGQQVCTRTTKESPDIYQGEIVDMVWHAQKQVPIFYLSIDGKKKSKRYFSEDLQAVI